MNKFLAKGLALKKFFAFSLVLITFSAFSQKEYYNWSFGEGVGISFLNTPATLYTHNIGAGGATQQVYEAMASISDGAGNLLFSTNGLSVWQANGAIMSGGNNTIKGSDDGGGVSSAQGVLVVGAPKNKNLYYIFTNDAANMIGTNPLGFNYCTVDMTANGGLGQVSATTRLQTAASANYTTTEMCAVVPAANGCDIWVLTRKALSNLILAYRITPAGINPVPVESDFSGNASRIALSNDLPYSVNDEGRGSITFSNSGDKFVITHHDQSWPYYDAIQLFDFNRTTGAATYSTEIGNQGWNSAVVAYDAVWSPDDSKIYVSFGGIWDIYQYDVTSWGNRLAIQGTQAVVPGTAAGGAPIPTGQLLIGPDGVLYRARKDIAYLGAISGNLNGVVGGLTYNPTAFNLGAFCASCVSDAALPNMAPILILNANIDTTGVNPICNNKAPFNLTATPAGGTWSASCGACITNSSTGAFNPGLASVGNNTIIYTISSCNADTVIVDVLACAGCKDTTLAASIPAVCSTNGTINLTLYQGTAAAGSWSIVSGGGTANISGGNTFNINNTPAGNYVVQYTVAGQPGGCGNNPQRTIKVNKPNVTLTLTDDAACINESAFNLSGGSPGGGTYSGTGVGVSPSFNPTTAGLGPHTITYSYTDINLCTATATDVLTVNDTTPVTFVLADDQICINEGTMNLSGGLPGGGTYSGTGITVSPTFNPITAGLGNKTITYTYTNGNGCVNSHTDVITVNDTSIVTLVLADDAACLNEAAFNLSGGSPGGGTYSGAGVGVSPSFNPGTAGVGPHTVTYTFSNNKGCTTNAKDVLTVNALPNVTFSLVDTAACINEAAFNLSGGSPGGGTYSGAGVGVSPSFNPTTAGLGPHTITYSYTDGNSCTVTATDVLTVNDTTPITFVLADDQICINEGTMNLSGGLPGGGVYSGTGITVSPTFNPITAGLGNKTITYTYTNGNGCVNSHTEVITVNDTSIVTLVLDDNAACVNETAFNLNGGSPGGGTYSGAGVGVSPSFNPGTAGVGPHTITYTFSNNKGCTTNAKDVLTVNALPNVTFSLVDDAACIDESAFALSGGSPNGGSYSGSGITVSPIFDPANAGGAGKKQITYTFTDVNSCVNSATDSISVNPLPIVTLSLSQDSACVNGGFVALAGGSPIGGTYSGIGVNSGNFDPTVNGTGNVTITYTYTNGNGCVNAQTDILTITDTAIVTVVFADVEACIDEAAFALSGGSPNGGTYSGAGITNSPTFNPANAGAGDHIITYTYTNAAGCTTNSKDTMTVNPLPVVTLTLGDPAACIDEVAFALSGGSPNGGTYSGAGVSAGNFDPTNAGGAGSKTITYTYTVGNGCVNSATANLSVNALPIVSLADANVCQGGSITLTPVPNTWSAHSWSTGSTNDTIHYNIPNTIVWVDVTDANGCVKRATASISLGDTLHVDFGVDQAICANQTVALNAAQYGPFQAPVTYDWDDINSGVEPSSRNVSQQKLYGVRVMDGRGCVGSDSINVIVHNLPKVSLGNDTLICFTGKKTLTKFLPDTFATYNWTNNTTDTSATTYAVGIFGVVVSNQFGCLAGDTINVGEHCDPTIICVPNVITPNGDGQNDIFKPCQDKMKEITDGEYKSIMDNILEINFQVFDRWGIKMFESSNVFPQWDANFNGKKVAGGVYYWIITYTDSSHAKYELTGWVQVIVE